MSTFTVASANVAGLRGATLTGKAAKIESGFDVWFKKMRASKAGLDILAIQETKMRLEEMEPALNKMGVQIGDFHLQDDVFRKGHAGVALWINPDTCVLKEIRTPFENLPHSEDFGYSGRWIEADVTVKGVDLTIINGYFHHADSPTLKNRDGILIEREKSVRSMDNKHHFMADATQRLRDLSAKNASVLLVGDVNIAHHNQDIRNWKGNFTKAGFLPEERAWLDLWFVSRDEDMTSISDTYAYNASIDYRTPETDQFKKGGLGLTDLTRKLYREDEIYTWWTNMGHAFDNNSGWRIDYQIASPSLAEKVQSVEVHKQDSYATRYSDHAPITATFMV
ncbi:MAG: endonuclease/exonuclease/phosphatase family protein [Candidatus Ancillula sp.]|jgi:exodeoxyribonuclease-3|nr:endonuclease/exonuclease/phosphatase family protein [Candidatus Ancillula sp.]